jgi:hypothetical protein
VEIKIDLSKLEKFAKDLKDLTKKQVKVGILNSKVNDKGVTLAGIGAVMELGSVINKTPARSFLKAPIENNFYNKLKDLKLDLNNIKNIHDELGKRAVETIKQSFDNASDGKNKWVANAEITINGGWMRNKKSGKVFYVKGKGTGKNPLTNTGNLKNSIEYEVKE